MTMDGGIKKAKNQNKFVLMSYLGRYSLLDELGFEQNALFHHVDNGCMTGIELFMSTDLFVTPVSFSDVLCIHGKSSENLFHCCLQKDWN